MRKGGFVWGPGASAQDITVKSQATGSISLEPGMVETVAVCDER